MATVSRGVYKITITVQDAKRQHSKFSFYVQRKTYEAPEEAVSKQDTSDPEQFALHVAERLDDMILGKIVKITVSTEITQRSFPQYDGDGQHLKLVADPASDVEEGAIWKWRAENGLTTQFRVPTFDELLFDTPEGTVDFPNADQSILDLVSDFLTGGAANWSLQMCEPRSKQLSDIEAIYEDFNRSRSSEV